MRNFIAFLKIFIFVLFMYAVYLYYTRPEMIITVDQFKKVATENGYKVSAVRGTDAKIAFAATNQYGIKVYYLGYENEEDAHNTYLKFVNKFDNKYSLKFHRDVRFRKSAAEMQTYYYQYKHYASIHAKNSVIYAETVTSNDKQLDKIFDALYQPPKFNLKQIM